MQEKTIHHVFAFGENMYNVKKFNHLREDSETLDSITLKYLSIQHPKGKTFKKFQVLHIVLNDSFFHAYPLPGYDVEKEKIVYTRDYIIETPYLDSISIILEDNRNYRELDIYPGTEIRIDYIKNFKPALSCDIL